MSERWRRRWFEPKVRLAVLVVAGIVAATVATGIGRPVDRPAAADPIGPRVDPAVLADPDAYPARGFWDIKGASTLWGVPNEDELLDHAAVGRLDTSWARFEPQRRLPPCTGAQVLYDGHCFQIDAHAEEQIGRFTDAGLPVVAIVFATPAWARPNRLCQPFNAWSDVFCAPDDPADFARFAGFLADRYDGTNGVGRITDFIIQNEVNLNQWFNVGCGKGVPCDFDAWVAEYADNYNLAYDAIRAHQARAKVMISLTQHFEPSLDAPTATHPAYSVKTFLPALVPLLGDREWSIAHHPYPRSVDPAIDARDLPYATMGNLGVLVGWLRATYPDDPHAWEVELTEQGFNNPGLFDEMQAESLCDTFRGVLGTSGIRSFLYHSLKDNPGEFGLSLGLHRTDGTPKPALDVWLHADDADDPSCGFENDGTTVVREGVHDDTGARWTSSRPLPSGYRMQERQWRLAYEQGPGTVLAFECGDGDAAATPATYPASTWLSLAADCDGAYPMGPVGWIGTAAAPGRTLLVACRQGDARTTAEGSCPGGWTSTALGWVDAEDVPADVLEEANAELDDPDDPEDPDDPAPPDPDLDGVDIAFRLESGSFRIGTAGEVPLPDGDPVSEGRTWLLGDWDESTGDLDLDLWAPAFGAAVQTTILPDPVPTTFELAQVGAATGRLDPDTGDFSLALTIDTRLSSEDPLFQVFLGQTCRLGPATLPLATEIPFDLTLDEPVADASAAGFGFPKARGCGPMGGDLDETLNAGLGLPTSDTAAAMRLVLVQGGPEVEVPPTSSSTSTSSSTTTTSSSTSTTVGSTSTSSTTTSSPTSSSTSTTVGSTSTSTSTSTSAPGSTTTAGPNVMPTWTVPGGGVDGDRRRTPRAPGATPIAGHVTYTG